MKKKCLKVLSLTSMLLVSSVYANTNMEDNSATQQAVFDIAAGTIGAVAGGPVGLVAGVALAEYIGDPKARKMDELEDQFADADIAELRKQLLLAQAEAGTLKELALRTAAFDVLFATSSDQINEHDIRRLKRLPAIVNEFPSLSISLAGFSDPRGNPEYNLALSKKRVDAVKNFLITSGVSEQQIIERAFGDKKAVAKERYKGKTTSQNSEDYVYDRSVAVNFVFKQ